MAFAVPEKILDNAEILRRFPQGNMESFLKVIGIEQRHILSEGESESDRAQIIPAFTTAVDPASPGYSKLTDQQRQYTYVVSGKDKLGNYTSDDHKMFGKEASANSILMVPLGGDKNPPRLNEAGDGYTWTPDWTQNNLYAFKNPELVTIENSVAGPTPVTADYTVDESTNFKYEYRVFKKIYSNQKKKYNMIFYLI